MKQFFTIYKFEIKNYLMDKAFIIITVILSLAVAVGLSIPRIIDFFGSSDTSQDEKEKMLISGFSEDTPESIKMSFEQALTDYEVVFENISENDINDAIKEGTYGCAVLITSDTSFKYIVNNLSMYDTNSTVLTELMQIKYRTEQMMKLGISEVEALTLSVAPVTSEIVSLNIDILENYFSIYIVIIMIMMCVVLYGSIIASSVATEKSSRAMEMLITCASPVNMMFAKIFAAISACLLQLILIIGCALISYNINLSYYEDVAIIQAIFNMDITTWGLIALFFIMGFLIFAFMFGALGSLVSKIEDVNKMITPAMMILMITFYVVFFNMENPSSTLMKVLSFIPFTSPMAMYVRVAMNAVSSVEIVISVAILLVTTLLIGYLSAIIYRLGTLLYGNPPKLKEIVKLIKTNK